LPKKQNHDKKEQWRRGFLGMGDEIEGKKRILEGEAGSKHCCCCATLEKRVSQSAWVTDPKKPALSGASKFTCRGKVHAFVRFPL